jgi:hypothetical protein
MILATSYRVCDAAMVRKSGHLPSSPSRVVVLQADVVSDKLMRGGYLEQYLGTTFLIRRVEHPVAALGLARPGLARVSPMIVSRSVV